MGAQFESFYTAGQVFIRPLQKLNGNLKIYGRAIRLLLYSRINWSKESIFQSQCTGLPKP